ncbi:MAG: hypothetical protein Kow00121_36550 [Elainellaceae cyanobacterium]
MVIRRYKFVKCLLLGLLFVASFLVASGLAPVHLRPVNAVIVAQAENADQWMQTGVEQYHTGNFLEAIDHWQTALALYQTANNLEQIAVTLENLARAYQALGRTSEELNYWEQAQATYQQVGNRLRVGRVLAEQAQAYSRLGQPSRAITLLCAVPDANKVQVCRAESALSIAQSLPDPDRVGEVIALGSLGDAYRLRGEPDRAIAYLEQGLAIARELPEPIYQISTLNSLGNAYLSLAEVGYRRALSAEQIEEESDVEEFESNAKGNDEEALKYLQESIILAQANHDRLAELRALISTLPIYYRANNIEEGRYIEQRRDSLQQAIALIAALPASQTKVYAAIDIARFEQLDTGNLDTGNLDTGNLDTGNLDTIFGRQCLSEAIAPQAKSLLEQAIAAAQQIADRRAESFALGELGHLYECQKNYDRALELTRQAQLTADQDLQSRDSLYLWQWQAGRIFKSQGNPVESIDAYEQSLATLAALRQDVLTANREAQFNLRETTEPIYRELVELRLQQEQPSTVIRVTIPENAPEQGNISLALSTLDDLKLAELQNYFGNDCVLTALNEVNINFASTAPQTAIFSTVVLEDQVAVILSIPTQLPSGEQQTLQQFEWIQDQNGYRINRDTLIATINEYRRGLEVVADAISGYDTTLAKQIYDWVIRPFAPLLQQNEIQTLVFVQDDIFRSIPMAALHDGNAFLVESYAIAVTPSLNLTNLERADRQRLRALAVGLTENATVGGIPFPALEYVESELQVVQEILPESTKLLDQDFTLDRFEQVLEAEAYPVIHIATHGKFSAEAENAFLVTGSSPTEPDQRLTINELDDIIRQASARSPVELLVLSACQTATGDDRAALGLAGIAAQAGAKRVLASLWSVNDRATTELITQFYQGVFNTEMTKAQALQEAQRALIQSGGTTAHPAFWAAFILIGNWL